MPSAPSSCAALIASADVGFDAASSASASFAFALPLSSGGPLSSPMNSSTFLNALAASAESVGLRRSSDAPSGSYWCDTRFAMSRSRCCVCAAVIDGSRWPGSASLARKKRNAKSYRRKRDGGSRDASMRRVAIIRSPSSSSVAPVIERSVPYLFASSFAPPPGRFLAPGRFALSLAAPPPPPPPPPLLPATERIVSARPRIVPCTCSRLSSSSSSTMSSSTCAQLNAPRLPLHTPVHHCGSPRSVIVMMSPSANGSRRSSPGGGTWSVLARAVVLCARRNVVYASSTDATSMPCSVSTVM
mmetsp:Transcript_24204/g.59054  ORF Transcript_24204/g.59054 Transcript_24204/m.59054 type:complete len:301 (-) Transcript_24204:953-1855(-)